MASASSADGATADGQKELIAEADGIREGEQSWKELLLDCQARCLEIDPALAIGDGVLVFWKAVRQVRPTTRSQRCRLHRTANVLDKLPKGVQLRAKAAQHALDGAAGREAAESARGRLTCTWRLTRRSTRLPGQGPGGVARLLRLPGGALPEASRSA